MRYLLNHIRIVTALVTIMGVLGEHWGLCHFSVRHP